MARRRAATSGRSRSWIAALLHWGRAVERATGRSVAEQPGAGAAGGTTSALLGFTNAVIRPGVEVVAEAVGLAELLAVADLVITGEGQADEQTLSGKAAMGVAALARGNGTPVILLCGGLGPGRRRARRVRRVRGGAADRRPADAPGRLDARHRATAGQRRRAGGAHHPGRAAPGRAGRLSVAAPRPSRRRRPSESGAVQARRSWPPIGANGARWPRWRSSDWASGTTTRPGPARGSTRSASWCSPSCRRTPPT